MRVFFSLRESKHFATLCLCSSAMGSHAIHLRPETSRNCAVATRPARRKRRRRSGMQRELQPRVRNTSGENMFPKNTEKREKTRRSKSRWCLRAARLHHGGRDLFINTGLWWNTLPAAIIFWVNHLPEQTGNFTRTRVQVDNKRVRVAERGRPSRFSKPITKTNSFVIVTVDKTMRIVEKMYCTRVRDCVSALYYCLTGRRCLTRCDPERSFCRIRQDQGRPQRRRVLVSPDRRRVCVGRAGGWWDGRWLTPRRITAQQQQKNIPDRCGQDVPTRRHPSAGRSGGENQGPPLGHQLGAISPGATEEEAGWESGGWGGVSLGLWTDRQSRCRHGYSLVL